MSTMLLVLSFPLFCYFIRLCYGHDIQAAPTARLEDGLVQGTVEKSRDGREYYAFKGVRYAEKPGRFQAPEPQKPWEGVMDATKHKSQCPQILGGGALPSMSMTGSEDCLFLSVYTPKVEITTMLPVMVWIHGGVFFMGCEDDYGPGLLMDEDVVVVVINYRLGALGFLYNEDELIPGNLGMRDQVEALWWVQKNIDQFGGNASLVTIFGESAGAASVNYHLLSPLSKGLFQRAIVQSGSALNPWALVPNPKWHAVRFAKALGCPWEDGNEMVQCLKGLDVEKLVEEQTAIFWATTFMYHWAPVVEKDKSVDESTAFLYQHPRVAMAAKKADPVPLLIGTVKNEGGMFSAALSSLQEMTGSDTFEELNNNVTTTFPALFYYLLSNGMEITPRMNDISRKLKDFYFGKLPIGLSTEQRLNDAISDRFFTLGVEASARAHSQIAPTWAYKLTFRGDFSFPDVLNYQHNERPVHSDDIPYLFNYFYKTKQDTKKEEEFSKKFIKLWVSFARTGRPEATWGIAGGNWPQVSASDNNFVWYKIDESPQLLSDEAHERLAIWNEYFDMENQIRPAPKLKCRKKKIFFQNKPLLEIAKFHTG